MLLIQQTTSYMDIRQNERKSCHWVSFSCIMCSQGHSFEDQHGSWQLLCWSECCQRETTAHEKPAPRNISSSWLFNLWPTSTVTRVSIRKVILTFFLRLQWLNSCSILLNLSLPWLHSLSHNRMGLMSGTLFHLPHSIKIIAIYEWLPNFKQQKILSGC